MAVPFFASSRIHWRLPKFEYLTTKVRAVLEAAIHLLFGPNARQYRNRRRLNSSRTSFQTRKRYLTNRPLLQTSCCIDLGVVSSTFLRFQTMKLPSYCTYSVIVWMIVFVVTMLPVLLQSLFSAAVSYAALYVARAEPVASRLRSLISRFS